MILNRRDNFSNLSKLVLLKVWNLWVDLKDICTESWADEFPVLPLCGENPCFVFMQDLRPIGFHSSPLGQGAFISTLFPEAVDLCLGPCMADFATLFLPLSFSKPLLYMREGCGEVGCDQWEMIITCNTWAPKGDSLLPPALPPIFLVITWWIRAWE